MNKPAIKPEYKPGIKTNERPLPNLTTAQALYDSARRCQRLWDAGDSHRISQWFGGTAPRSQPNPDAETLISSLEPRKKAWDAFESARAAYLLHEANTGETADERDGTDEYLPSLRTASPQRSLPHFKAIESPEWRRRAKNAPEQKLLGAAASNNAGVVRWIFWVVSTDSAGQVAYELFASKQDAEEFGDQLPNRKYEIRLCLSRSEYFYAYAAKSGLSTEHIAEVVQRASYSPCEKCTVDGEVRYFRTQTSAALNRTEGEKQDTVQPEQLPKLLAKANKKNCFFWYTDIQKQNGNDYFCAFE